MNYWKKITDIADAQKKKGVKKYGTTLDKNPACFGVRVRHIEEELIDALFYLEWLKDGWHVYDEEAEGADVPEYPEYVLVIDRGNVPEVATWNGERWTNRHGENVCVKMWRNIYL